jgi:excisionase family DNA binding protein
LDPGLTREELAAVLGCSVSTLNKLAMGTAGPPYVRIGRRVRYPSAGVQAWLRTRLLGAAPEPAPEPPAEPPKRGRGRPRIYD